jgi:pimeloyl-ACP methyl ester carboxylesterase
MILPMRTEILPGPPPWPVHHRYARVNGVRLHYVEALPQSATTVKGQASVCCALHGFPDFWYSWRHQLPALAAAGFHVVAPDLRGYNLSDKPAGVRSYRLEHLTEDVAGLIRQAGADKAVVAGHDWGGAIAWNLAMRLPYLMDRLIILNAPHPAAFMREIRTLNQLRKSWYMFFFQLPLLPELWIRAGNYAVLDRIFRSKPVRPGSFTDEDVERHKEALARPGALTAAINYYRAAFRAGLSNAARSLRRTDVPTLLLWGDKDPYLGMRLTEGLEQWVPKLQVVHIPEAGHWVHIDVAAEVNQRIIDFLF